MPRGGDVIAIPKASSAAHARENAAAAPIDLTREDLRDLDAAFPAPDGPTPRDMVQMPEGAHGRRMACRPPRAVYAK